MPHMTAPAKPTKKKKKKIDSARAWAEARALLREHRGPLAIGIALGIVNVLLWVVLLVYWLSQDA